MEQIPVWAQEIRERLVRIETKLEPYNGIREAAYKAKSLAEQHEEELNELKDDRKWLWRTTAGAFLVGGISLLLNFLFRNS